MRRACGEAEPAEKLFVIIKFFNKGMLMMSRTAKVLRSNADGYCVVELLDAAGKIVGFVLLDPDGQHLGTFASLKDALKALEEFTPPSDKSSGPSFGP